MTGTAGPGARLAERFDAIVMGAGGMCMLHHLGERGLSIRAFEAGSDVGGTRYWTRYPGARCDVESVEYEFGSSDTLQRGWTWTERFATQPEILALSELRRRAARPAARNSLRHARGDRRISRTICRLGSRDGPPGHRLCALSRHRDGMPVHGARSVIRASQISPAAASTPAPGHA